MCCYLPNALVLLENPLSNNLTTKVSLALVCPVKYVCENVVSYNYYFS